MILDADYCVLLDTFPVMQIPFDNIEIIVKENPEKQLLRKQKFQNLSQEAKFVLHVLLERSEDLNHACVRPYFNKNTQAKLTAVLRKLGWQHKTIRLAKNEIRKCLKGE